MIIENIKTKERYEGECVDVIDRNQTPTPEQITQYIAMKLDKKVLSVLKGEIKLDAINKHLKAESTMRKAVPFDRYVLKTGERIRVFPMTVWRVVV